LPGASVDLPKPRTHIGTIAHRSQQALIMLNEEIAAIQARMRMANLVENEQANI
jgi:hypothetical protein